VDSLLIPNPAEPDAPSVNFTPDIKEVARSTRSVRSDATEPAEIRESDHPEPGTRFDAPTRSVRSETSLDLPGAGLFAGLTDGDRERAASSSIGDGGEADGDDTIEPPPCPEQSPLRGLDPLAAGPDAAVPVTAGEKSAEAASTMFPNVVCTTSRGGSKAPHRSGRIPLHRRQLTFLLDQDEAGASSAAKVGDRTTPAGVVSKRALAVPHNSPNGLKSHWTMPQTAPPPSCRAAFG